MPTRPATVHVVHVDGRGGLAAARVLLPCAAGVYIPNASAFAVALARPKRCGRAIGIVNAGLTLAIAIGVPPGAVVGASPSSRPLPVVGLLAGLPARAGASMVTATIRERVRVGRQRALRQLSS